MRPFATLVVAAAVLVGLIAIPASSAEETLIAANSLWKFNDKGTNLGTSWRTTSYSDATWSQGNAELGYGDGDESTVLGFGSSTNRYITYYFRRSFTVANPAAFTALTLRYMRDDGCVIYVNGVEVVRSNMPTGTISYTTRAVTGLGEPEEDAWLQTPLSPSLLVAGTNVIAVEVHQQSPTSTDVSFNLELRATTPAVTPQVTLTSPTNQSTVNSGAVTFTANATAPSGLASATLLVAAAPATVSFSGSSQIEDAQMTLETPTTPNGTAAAINIDGQTPHAHGLLRAPSMIGNGAGQVPPGSTIQSAILQLNCTNSGNMMQLYRLTESWVEDQASWNERQIGIPWTNPGADGAGSNAQVAIAGDCTATGTRNIDITSFVQQWSSGSPNYGVVLTDSGTDGIDFSSSESGASPVITITYKVAPQELGTQSLSGTSATVSIPANLPLGTYFWNVRVTDLQGQQSIAGSDFQVTLDAASPGTPTLVSPADGATGVPVSTALTVGVSNPSGGSLNVEFQVRQPAAPEFTIIALPDTQNYSEFYPDIFTAQTQWIVQQAAARNIVFVTHEGDVVNHPSSVTEYQRANASMSLLDGVVPYGIAPGNHDEPTNLFNQYFPYTRYQPFTWYGGHYLNLNDNNYELFSGGGLDFVIVHLDFCPSAAVVSWGSSVFQQYPNRIGIMTTHGYLNPSGQRSVGLCSNTQYLWDGLAVPNPNLHFMLSGHEHPNGEARRADVANGHPVHQIMADYQDRANGGEGWLRIMRFVPGENKIYVQTYSPWLNQYETDANSQFTLDFPMGGAFATVGTASASSGSTATLPLSNLNPDQTYEWRAIVTNASGKTVTGPTWTFRTSSAAPPNLPPVAHGGSANTTANTPVTIILGGTDPEGSPITYAIADPPAHGSLSGSQQILTYTPNPGFSGSDSFTFRVSDGVLQSDPGTISITVEPPANQAPTANSAAATTAANTPVSITLTGSDPEGSALTYSIVGSPASGSLSGIPPSVTYTPNAGFSGADSFTFRVNDGTTNSGLATISITVTPPPNQAPTANNGSATTAASTPVAITLTGSDPEGSALTYSIIGSPAGGSLSGVPPSVTYTPNAGFSGPDSFTFRVSDGALQSNLATISINVSAPPPPPGPVNVFTANFSSGSDSFSYLDDTFGTAQPTYASGTRVTTGGYNNGAALRVTVGGVNNNAINNMSGGWRRTFNLNSAGTVTLTFRYNLTAGGDYESDELSRVLASVDGALLGNSGYIAQVVGNGEGGAAVTTGWQQYTVSIPLAAGSHTLVIGGFNNRKTTQSESSTITIDDVGVTLQP